MAAQEGGFRLITIEEDEEELVVRAGSGKAPDAADSAAVAAPADPPVEPEPGDSPASMHNPHQEELRRRAEELAQAQAGLEDPHTFSGMRIAVLVVLALAMIAFVVYLAMTPG